jgi:4-amino-4-deoxy-L-arabinose transferase-like glycosyltransferase
MKTPLLSGPRAWLPFLILLSLLGLTLRLIDLNDPPLDFHTSRQLRNSLVARNIYYQLLPDADPHLRELASSFERTVGHYEPPVIESLVAVTYLATGGENYAVPRIWESIFWVLAGIALFALARRAISPWAGLTALAYYLVLPFAVQASRSFQPDPLMTSAFVAGIYFLYRWSEDLTPSPSPERRGEHGWKWAIWAGIFLGLATLVKVVIAFLIGAAAVAVVLFTLRREFWKSRQVWVMALLMIVPALAYYVFLNPGRSSEYFVNWSVALFKLISSSDFYSKWLSFLGSLFGLTVLFGSLAGALIASPRLRWLLIGLWIGYLAYGLTLPFQMYTHSYYHIQLAPVVALGLAVVLDPLYKAVAAQSVAGRVAFVALALAVIGYQSWVARSVLVAEDFRHEPAVWRKIGDAIPADANVIGLTQDYGYRLMLFAWRKVDLWPLNTDLADLRNQDRDPASRFDEITAGNDYFLVTAFGQLDKQPGLKKILDQYPVTAEGDGFVLYDLR